MVCPSPQVVFVWMTLNLCLLNFPSLQWHHTAHGAGIDVSSFTVCESFIFNTQRWNSSSFWSEYIVETEAETFLFLYIRVMNSPSCTLFSCVYLSVWNPAVVLTLCFLSETHFLLYEINPVWLWAAGCFSDEVKHKHLFPIRRLFDQRRIILLSLSDVSLALNWLVFWWTDEDTLRSASVSVRGSEVVKGYEPQNCKKKHKQIKHIH